jgi:DDE superfamily endonuclease
MHDPADPNTQNAYYNGWKAMCSITNVIVFAPDGSIIWVRYNWPGSWHDANVARPLYDVLADSTLTPSPYALIADTAFPRRKEMRNKIITPDRVDEFYNRNLQLASADNAEYDCYNRQVLSARQAVEWGMHSLQSVFRRLSVRLDYNPPANRDLLKLIFHLFNLRVRMVGLNQIRSVYYDGPVPQ